MHRFVLVLILLGVFASPARAATYFVSQQGSDANSCEASQGWTEWEQRQSISAGLACLSPGDTLYIHGGTYTGWNDVIDSQAFHVPSGTPWSPVTIAAYPGERVTIMPPSNSSAIRLTSGAPEYLVFRDFAIDMSSSTPGADASGIYVSTAHHIRFERLEVRHSAAFGAHFAQDSSYNEMLNCDIHDNGYYGGGITDGHGLYVSGSNNVFDGNAVYNNRGYGVHVYNNYGSHENPSFNVVRNNRIYGNGLYVGAYGVVFAWGYGNVAADNVISGNGGGVQVYTDAAGTAIHRNVISDNAAEGIALQYYGPGNVVSGNAVYGNSPDIQDYGGSGANAFVSDNWTGF